MARAPAACRPPVNRFKIINVYCLNISFTIFPWVIHYHYLSTVRAVWLRTNEVGADGAAAEAMDFDRLWKRKYALALLGRKK